MALYETTFLNYPIRIEMQKYGDDVNVICTGGIKPHLGGCAMAIPYLRCNGKPSAAVSTLSAPGHQDSILAADIAKNLCKQFDRTVFVQCGIHYEKLQPDQLKRLQETVLSAFNEVEEYL